MFYIYISRIAERGGAIHGSGVEDWGFVHKLLSVLLLAQSGSLSVDLVWQYHTYDQEGSS